MPIDIQNKVATMIVVPENRSFDHMLGYLSLTNGANRTDIDGITSLRRNAYIHSSAGDTTDPFSGNTVHFLSTSMQGFVEVYRQLIGTNRVLTKPNRWRSIMHPYGVGGQ
jgi:phospholipase C